ncbi:MAG: carbon-nitrogen hydrolase family protein [Planctomycetota bacterium]
MHDLRVACLQMQPSADPAANRDRILAGIAAAARAHAHVLLTPECALCGYPGAARQDLSGIAWCPYADHEDLLHIRAEAAGIALVLGTASQLPEGGIGNDAFCCGAGGAPVRYRKSCLTPTDRAIFRAGSQSLVVERFGWRLGLSVCFDLRFDDCWADQAMAGADVFLSIAHMAGSDPDPGTKQAVLPGLYQTRAATWATPLVLCTALAPDAWIASGAWDGRGMPMTLVQQEELLLVSLHARDRLQTWYQELRREHLERCRHWSSPPP